MNKILGIIAGEGNMPIYIARNAYQRGYEVVVLGMKGNAREADYKEYCFSNTCKATDIISYTNKLLYNDEVIVLLTLLNENILVVEQVLGIDYLVKSRKFLLVDRNATTLDKLAHLAL